MNGEPRFRVDQYIIDTKRKKGERAVQVVGWINTAHWNDEAVIYILADDDEEIYLAPSWGDRLKSYQEFYGQEE